MSTAGNFLIYLFLTQIPFFPPACILAPQSKNKFRSFKSDGQCKLQVQACCVCTLHDGAQSKYLREHILCTFKFWHCTALGCEGYLDRTAGDCKHLNVYRRFSSYIQTPSSLSHAHTFLCALLDLGFQKWTIVDVAEIVRLQLFLYTPPESH